MAADEIRLTTYKVYIMKHLSRVTRKPLRAQVNLADIFTAIGEVLKVVGALLVTKEQNNGDPYDWSTDTTTLTDITSLL